MPTRQPDPTHEIETNQPTPPTAPEADVQSPSADQMTGANGPAVTSADDPDSAADQEIDIAGTEADGTSAHHKLLMAGAGGGYVSFD